MNNQFRPDTFIHLHLHSEFSLEDGLVRLTSLVNKLTNLQQPAVALTDLFNLYGVVKFYKICIAHGIKPLIGSDIWIENPLNANFRERIILLCQNNQGYQNLLKLLTDAYLESKKRNRVIVTWKNLCEFNEGLIVILDEHDGPVAKIFKTQGKKGNFCVLDLYQNLFKNSVYLAISRICKFGEEEYISLTIELAKEKQVALVANNRVEFIDQSDFSAHEVRVCINDGYFLDDKKRLRKFTNQQYLKSTDEMWGLFSDIPEAISNTLEIAKRCNVFIQFGTDHLPNYPVKSYKSVSLILREKTENGLINRLKNDKLISNATNNTERDDCIPNKYRERMEMELGVIEKMGYPGYFLIVADFTRWSRENRIMVGPGRGSGAGSLVAWATGITELNPLMYGLLFERFLNPERVSLPDFDIDFCVDGRDKVIDYVSRRYGREKVAQIITFGTMTAKSVVRDVGRVMGFTYGFVDQVAKLIPVEVGITLKRALKKESVLNKRYMQDANVQELIDISMQLEGVTRNIGKHAGGVVISPKALTEYTPLYKDRHLNQPITQLDKDDLEHIGLVKFDLLGLRTLTIIDSTLRFINQSKLKQGISPLYLEHISKNDEKTFNLVQSGKTMAVFQLESHGMREIVIRLKPDSFDDLIALVALFRPGPLQSGMVDDFINRKHGRASIKYPHPDIESVLGATYGVILYQEQIMQIAQILAGYTLSGADLLRRAIGKKKPEEMNKHKDIFINGAVKRGVDLCVAEYIFNLIAKFASYGFNKSHSAAYALIAYQTAWLKTHYPAEYMAFTLSADIDHTEKLVLLLEECTNLGLKILPPDINTCNYGFHPVNSSQILYGIGALKGVGKGVAESIVKERNKNGIFKDLFDLCSRLDPLKINKKVLQSLIKSGAMDSLCEHRAKLIENISQFIQAADQKRKNYSIRQFDMFGIINPSIKNKHELSIPEWTEDERLAAEKETVGLYLTGHPYSKFNHELNPLITKHIDYLDLSRPKNGVFAGLLIEKKVLSTRYGKMALLTLDNIKDKLEVRLYAKKFYQYSSILHKDAILIAQGAFSISPFTRVFQMRAEKIYNLSSLRERFLSMISIKILENTLSDQVSKQLKDLLFPYKGGRTRIRIKYKSTEKQVLELEFGDKWKIVPNLTLLDRLIEIFGNRSLQFFYDIDAIHFGLIK